MKPKIVPRFYMSQKAVALMRCYHCDGYHLNWEQMRACASRKEITPEEIARPAVATIGEHFNYRHAGRVIAERMRLHNEVTS